MRDSPRAISRLALEHQAPEDPAHLFKGRVFAKLRRGQDVGRLSQLGDFVLIGPFDFDVHESSISVDGHSAVGRQAPAPVQRQALEHGFDVFGLGCRAEHLQCQLLGFVHQFVPRVIVHGGSVAVVGKGIHSWFLHQINLSWPMHFARST